MSGVNEVPYEHEFTSGLVYASYLLCYFWRPGVDSMPSHDEASGASPRSASNRVFYNGWVFSAWHLQVKAELSKSVGWKPRGGWTACRCSSAVFSSSMPCVFPFPPLWSHSMFSSMLDRRLTPVCRRCRQDSTNHLFTLHISWFTIWFISLSVAFLLLFPLSLSLSFHPWPVLQEARRAGGNKTSSNQCVEWISFEDAFKGAV